MHKIWNRLISRRKFLQWQISGSAAALTSLNLAFPFKLLAANMPDLVVVQGEPAQCTRKAIDALGGINAFVRPGDKVIIKPNMSFDNPPQAATNTNPKVTQALAALCRQAGAQKVSILDNTLQNAELCLETSQIATAAEAVDICKVEAVKDKDKFQETPVPQGKELSSTQVIKEVLQADVLIAAPVAKHHGSTGVSLSLKGMMGLIYNRTAFHWRYNLHTAIVDLCTLLQADLTVIDVSRALTTNGPSGPGKVVRMDTIVASRDMVAADAQVVSMVKWYGRHIAPDKVEHLLKAHERGLGRMDLSNLNVKKIRL